MSHASYRTTLPCNEFNAQHHAHYRLMLARAVCILISMNSRQIIKRLKQDGWTHVRTTGDHHHFTHDTKPGIVTVTHPKKNLPIGTMKSIEKQSGLKLR